MYVCICNALPESAVRSAARGTELQDAADVFQSLGAVEQCGQCCDMMEAILQEERGRAMVLARQD